MPVYEFHCRPCDKDFEALVRSADRARDVECPTCGTRDIERRLSVFAARSESPKPAAGGACGRCGDPNGPCGT